MYFFVSATNEKLALDIEDGFKAAIADGSYDKLFFSNPMILNALKKANLKERVVLKLSNSNIPSNISTQQINWFKLDDLKHLELEE